MPEVEREVFQAQREHKKIIPYFHRGVSKNEIKWDLGRLQGIKFGTIFELRGYLYSKITKIQK